MSSHSESNGEKNKAGRELKDQLIHSFNELIEQKIILNFENEKNFNHRGFLYEHQYLINFVVETLDNKYILIRSSTSFRSDRFKQPAYDIYGVLNNSEISSDVVASIMLFPDSEIENTNFISFRQKVKDGIIYSPASHILTISEFYKFLENHKATVEAEKEEIESSIESTLIRDGSYYGKAGNALEKEVVKILNNVVYLKEYKNNICEEIIFVRVLDQLCTNKFEKENIISIHSTNTVEKLASGGNAKTDVIINISTNDGGCFTETLSIKKSNEAVVSCHDYKYEDFIRVLDIKDCKLEKYFKLFQENPTYSSFEDNLPDGFSIQNFEEELQPYTQKFAQWVLTGQHDDQNLTSPTKQISKNLLILTSDQVFCSDFASYINKIFETSQMKYGVPFRWTYPSKQRGKRIQLKMPIII